MKDEITKIRLLSNFHKDIVEDYLDFQRMQWWFQCPKEANFLVMVIKIAIKTLLLWGIPQRGDEIEHKRIKTASEIA